LFFGFALFKKWIIASTTQDHQQATLP